jgi:hypothetical protein
MPSGGSAAAPSSINPEPMTVTSAQMNCWRALCEEYRGLIEEDEAAGHAELFLEPRTEMEGSIKIDELKRLMVARYTGKDGRPAVLPPPDECYFGAFDDWEDWSYPSQVETLRIPRRA